MIGEGIDRQSRLPAFENQLGAHIALNLPELLVPVLVEAVYTPGRALVADLESIVIAYSEGREAELEAMKETLEKLYERLMQLKDEAFSLLEPLHSISLSGDYESELYDVTLQLEKNLGLEGTEPGTGALAPLGSGVFEFVGRPMQRLNEYVYNRMNGEKVEEEFIQRTGINEALDHAVDKLRESPYGECWKKGGSFKEKKVDKMENLLANFSLVMSEVASKIMEQEAISFAERMRTALMACANVVVDHIEQQAQIELKQVGFQGLRGVFRGEYDINPPKLPKLHFMVESEKKTILEIRQEFETYWVKERKWYFLYLAKKHTKKQELWKEKKRPKV